MKQFIFMALCVLMPLTSFAQKMPEFNARQKAVMARISQKGDNEAQPAKAVRKAAGNNTSTDFVENIAGVSFYDKLDSVVYISNGERNMRRIIDRDENNQVSVVTNQYDFGNGWEDTQRYCFDTSGKDLICTTEYPNGSSWEPRYRTTYYGANENDYLKEKYSNGSWVAIESQRFTFDADGNIIAQQSNDYVDGVEVPNYRIELVYNNGLMTQIKFYDVEDGTFVLEETNDYTYDSEGRVEKISGDGWLEVFSYEDGVTYIYEYTIDGNGNQVKTSTYAYVPGNDEIGFFATCEYIYDGQGNAIDGYYYEKVSEDANSASFDEYNFDHDANKFVVKQNILLTFDNDGVLVEKAYREKDGDGWYVNSRTTYGYLNDGRKKYEISYSSADRITSATIYFFEDDATDPTPVQSIAQDRVVSSVAAYDISGRPVNIARHHGIAIINGRKVMVK